MVDYSHSSHLLASRLLETSLEAGVLAFHNNVNYSCGTAPDFNRLRILALPSGAKGASSDSYFLFDKSIS